MDRKLYLTVFANANFMKGIEYMDTNRDLALGHFRIALSIYRI